MFLRGIVSNEMTRDDMGNREYKVTYRISECSPNEGPASVLLCPGLPVLGSSYRVGTDFDYWATCRMPLRVTPVIKQEPANDWDVEVTFKSGGDSKRCRDQQIDDPLLTPPSVSGTSIKYNKEETNDRFGFPIVNSAWEQIRGAVVEFDNNRDGVRIKMNVASFKSIILAEAMRDHVNMFPLWGFARRCVKLSASPWESKFYGTCYKYYELTLEFDTNSETFDRDILDEGTKVLNGHWDLTSGNWIVDNIGGLPTPNKPALIATVFPGGMPAGTYVWRVSAFNDLGETLASNEATKTLAPGNTYKVTLTWPRVIGATEYGIFWGTTGAAHRIAQVVRNAGEKWPANSYADTGAAHPGAGDPPTTNTTGGIPPDSHFPSHFIRYKDRHGENTRVILNGAGLPATEVLRFDDFKQYVSVTGANTGFPLSDSLHWIQVAPPGTKANQSQVWDNGTNYIPGNIVQSFKGVHVCVLANTNHDPFDDNNNGPPPTKPWVNVKPGATNLMPSINFKGTYDITVTYNLGDYVTASSTAGSNHVEAYDEADFTLLRIPLIL